MEFLQLVQELGIDTQQVLNRFSGNEELFRRFICKFAQEPTYSQFAGAFASGDYESSKKFVHTLKGIAANLGLEHLYKLSVEMLEDLRGRQENLELFFQLIQAEYQRITGLIKEFVAQDN